MCLPPGLPCVEPYSNNHHALHMDLNRVIQCGWLTVVDVIRLLISLFSLGFQQLYLRSTNGCYPRYVRFVTLIRTPQDLLSFPDGSFYRFSLALQLGFIHTKQKWDNELREIVTIGMQGERRQIAKHISYSLSLSLSVIETFPLIRIATCNFLFRNVLAVYIVGYSVKNFLKGNICHNCSLLLKSVWNWIPRKQDRAEQFSKDFKKNLRKCSWQKKKKKITWETFDSFKTVLLLELIEKFSSKTCVFQ